MLALAADILWEQKLSCAASAAVLTAVDSPEDAGLLHELLVDCDVATANRLTDRVLEQMVDAGLDKPGLAFSFLPQAMAHAD